MSIRDIFKKGLRWTIGIGCEVLFWKDNWCLQTPLSQYAKQGIQIMDNSVADFILPGRIWDIPQLKNLIPDHIVDSILSIPIPEQGTQDKLIWGLTPKGVFSTRTTGWLAQGLLNHGIEPSKFARIWNIDLPPKIKHFLWKACVNGLATKVRLNQSRIRFRLSCDLCDAQRYCSFIF